MEALHISRVKRARNYVAKKEDHKKHDHTDNPNPEIISCTYISMHSPSIILAR
jgi:hypothetical protein